MARLFREPGTQCFHAAELTQFIQPGVVAMESDGGSRQENTLCRAAHFRGVGIVSIVQALGSFCKGQTWKDSAAGLR